ncbi:hypothetical protein P4E94_00945 [Pontiellaceae bacterium B12219]|nr:hypothetical protein [Pontiellaceae bacterium B12219]
MKVLSVFIIGLLISGCCTSKKANPTNMNVEVLLDEIQIAVNEINASVIKGSLPPLQKAEVSIDAKFTRVTDGTVKLVIYAGGKKTNSESTALKMVLVPNDRTTSNLVPSMGQRMATSVIEAMSAIDNQSALTLKLLTVEAGIVIDKEGGAGIDTEYEGITIKAGHSRAASSGNTIKLFFEEIANSSTNDCNVVDISSSAVALITGCAPLDISSESNKKDIRGSGACNKCGCKSWRGDSGEPEKCININVPTKKLCQHSQKEHK